MIGSKVIISGGYGHDGNALAHTELLDLKTGQCIQLPDLPEPKDGVTGGLLGDIPLVIGGYQDDEVLQIGKDAIIPFASHLNAMRWYAATTQKNQSLWVTGGQEDGQNKLKSTELIQRDGTIIAGPDLPVAAEFHAIVDQHDDTYMLIGGDTDDGEESKATYVYNGQSGKWTKGPYLLEGRYGHSAGILYDVITHDQYTVVVGGYNGRDDLSSVEVLKSGSTEWAQGKHIKHSFAFCHSVEFDQFSLLLGTPLPIPLWGHQMTNWHNNLVVLGGETTGRSMSSSCYLLECHNGEFTWQVLEAKMMKAREDFAAIKISELVAKTWDIIEQQ